MDNHGTLWVLNMFGQMTWWYWPRPIIAWVHSSAILNSYLRYVFWQGAKFNYRTCFFSFVRGATIRCISASLNLHLPLKKVINFVSWLHLYNSLFGKCSSQFHTEKVVDDVIMMMSLFVIYRPFVEVSGYTQCPWWQDRLELLPSNSPKGLYSLEN